MSKRALKQYLKDLTKEQLEMQITGLYEKFKEVKAYYDFAFNPNEAKRQGEAKFRISKEYFPLNSRKPKKRRSVAQKLIRQFRQLGVEPSIIADIMLYHIEIAQAYNHEYPIHQEAFYISMLKSFEEAVDFITEYGLNAEFESRIKKISEESWDQQWFNRGGFERKINLTGY